MLRYSLVCFSNVNPHVQSIIILLHEMKISSRVVQTLGGISARFTVIKLFHIIAILFLHCCRLMCEMKSNHGLTSWNFNLGWNSPPLRSSFLEKLAIFSKGLHLRCLANSFTCLCCVRVNDLSINFPTQSYLLLSCFLVCGDLKLFSFSTFSIYMNLIHFHYSWRLNRILKIGDILIYFYKAEVRNYIGIRP